ncbi:hypothetical protein PR048_016737 [Dryococelus australis]|uniref:Uncharacterized protein n=1 Tax=Dryococelus australis TaxID=614101 RepID=A0ABQ9H7M9_9NEOP|nr:hypothetical protein PR048_016737 [Dryococelus australis]
MTFRCGVVNSPAGYSLLRNRERPSGNQVKHFNPFLGSECTCSLTCGNPAWLNRASSRYPTIDDEQLEKCPAICDCEYQAVKSEARRPDYSTIYTASSGRQGAAVAERLARSPPTKANRAQSPPGLPDLRKWESCRTMPLVGGFSRGSPVPPVPSFQRRSIFSSIPLIGSQDLAVKSHPNLFALSLTHSGCLEYVVRKKDDVGGRVRLRPKGSAGIVFNKALIHTIPQEAEVLKVKEAVGIAERRMEGARVCEAELVASSSHQTALGRARSAAHLSSV